MTPIACLSRRGLDRCLSISVLAVILVVAGCWISSVSARAEAIAIDQKYFPTSQWGGTARSQDIWGQTFRPQAAGKLMGLEIEPTRSLDLSAPLIVTLRVLSTLQQLAVVQVSADDVPLWSSTNSHRLAIDFSGFGVTLSPTTDYVFDFTSPLVSPPEYSIALGCPDSNCQQDGYPAGYAHQSYIQRREDFLFRTFMLFPDPTPRPADLVVAPADLEGWVGGTVTFRSQATGSLPLSFQWYKSGVVIPDATNAALQIEVVSASADLYSVSVSNRVGRAISPAARLTVHPGAEILYEPTDTYVPLGRQADLRVTAVGNGPLSYQWYREGTAIQGATGPVYSWVPVLSDNGTYWVVVTAGQSRAESTHVQLEVRDDSSRVRWRVPMYYPWSCPAVSTNGQIYLVTYNRERFSISPGGAVDWHGSTAAGGGFSPAVLLEDRGLLVAGWGFDILSLASGGMTSAFSSAVNITSAPSYDSDTDRVFTADDVGMVRCHSSAGSLVWAKSISSQRFVVPLAYAPSTRTLCLITGEGDLAGLDPDSGSVRWRKSGGATPYSFTLSVDPSGNLLIPSGTNLLAIESHSGTELWRYTDTNWMTSEVIIGSQGVLYVGTSAGMVALDPAGRPIWSTPLVGGASATPALANDGTLYVGHAQFVSALDSSTGQKLWDYLAPDYVRNGIAIAPDGSVLVVATSGSVSGDALIALKGSSPLASTPWPKTRGNMANTGVGVSLAPPRIVSQPVSVSTVEGAPTLLSVKSSGVQPFSYQWLLDGVAIPSATNSTLLVGAGDLTPAGDYSVVVGNTYGAITSSIAHVTILGVPRTWVKTLAGDGQPGDVDDPDARYGELRSPAGLARLSDDTVIIPSGNNIRALHADGRLTTFSGRVAPGSTNGSATDAAFSSPSAIAVAPHGDLVVADTGNHLIRFVNRSTRVTTTFAGTGVAGFRDGTPLESLFNRPIGIAVNSQGAVYVTESASHRIRRIAGGTVSTISGGPTGGFKDGAASQALFSQPRGLAFDAQDNLYIADYGNHRIRKLSKDGTVSTVAGTNTLGNLDGLLPQALLGSPVAVAAGPGDWIYFLEAGVHSVRGVLQRVGVVTLAGVAGQAGNVNGTNTLARFSGPTGITLDRDGSLLISDTGNNQIRRVSFTPPEVRPLPVGNLAIMLRPWLTLSGQPGWSFNVESSETPFGPWTALTNITLSTSNTSWFDTRFGPDPRYYRAVKQP